MYTEVQYLHMYTYNHCQLKWLLPESPYSFRILCLEWVVGSENSQ